jgi:[glutamine synthetase] adenylyltransferase / [glutamine synthetase]-adenylyl-L-tyrosine phosphorylase
VNEIFGGQDLTIIALGKFGGREITYGADLDVLFVGEENRDAQKILSTMAQPSAEGSLPCVDARLRPEGEKGPLVGSLESYRHYYSGRAQLWELQALTRARAITGPRQEDFITMAKAIWREAGQDADLFSKIDSMRERIRRERSSRSEFLDLKTGTGGIVEAEFLVQARQMREGIWEPNWIRAVDLLSEAGHFAEFESVELKRAYEFLRRCESVLRRYENKPVSTLPGDEVEQRRFSRRLGFENIETFTKEYHAARSLIREIYNRRIHGTQRLETSQQSQDFLEKKKA